jgi:prepilin-type N-terminal cleavage/methylation domain
MQLANRTQPAKPMRRGFTMIEVLVALAIIAVLTAVLLPTLSNKLRDSRTAALSQTFLGLSQGIAEFKRATTKYPGSLLDLTTAPVASTTSDKDICGFVYSAANASSWRGPYASRDIPSSGLQIGDAVIQPALGSVLSGTPIFILINAIGVESSTVTDLEAQLDGNSNQNAGTIRWTAGSSSSILNVSYAIPVNSC